MIGSPDDVLDWSQNALETLMESWINEKTSMVRAVPVTGEHLEGPADSATIAEGNVALLLALLH